MDTNLYSNDISDVLNEWTDYSDGETSNGRPQWFKLWVEKYATALDIENIDEDLTPKEKNVLLGRNTMRAHKNP